jgi:hypothetical protein
MTSTGVRMHARRHGETKSSRRSQLDELLVELLATGRTYEETGALANVSARTVRRRMASPAFAAPVSTLRAGSTWGGGRATGQRRCGSG